MTMAFLISADSLLASDNHKSSGGCECGFIPKKKHNGGTDLEDASEDDGKHLMRS